MDSLPPERGHFYRHPGQKDRSFAAFFILHRHCRRRAPVVFKYDSPLGDHRLLYVVFGHFSARVGKIAAYFFKRMPVKVHIKPEIVGYRLFGKVVARGAETPAEKYRVGMPESRRERAFEALGVVAHHSLTVDRDPHFGKTLRHERRICVYDVAEQQLGAHAEYLRDFYFSFKHKTLRHDPTVVRRGSDLHFAAYGAKTGDADENYPSHASYARTVHLKRRIHTSNILHICNIY